MGSGTVHRTNTAAAPAGVVRLKGSSRPSRQSYALWSRSGSRRSLQTLRDEYNITLLYWYGRCFRGGRRDFSRNVRGSPPPPTPPGEGRGGQERRGTDGRGGAKKQIKLSGRTPGRARPEFPVPGSRKSGGRKVRNSGRTIIYIILYRVAGGRRRRRPDVSFCFTAYHK